MNDHITEEKSGVYRITISGIKYIVYCDKSKKICVINSTISCHNNVNKMIKLLERYLDPSYIIWVAVNITCPYFTNCIIQYANLGFIDPTITNKTPMNKTISHSVALIRYLDGNNTKDPFTVILNVRYLLKQYKKHGCSMRVKFSNKAVRFLKKTSKMGHTKNSDHSITQKELTGNLYVDKIIEDNGEPLFIIGCAESAVEPGIEEEVNVSATRYNFHSHPEEAYVRHNVNKAWPSLTDYIGYLKLGTKTIFHCVATLEGIYILSFSKEWVKKLHKIDKKFIHKHYNIDHKHNITPYEYMNKINHILYKGAPIFIIKFLSWNQAVHTIFSVSYKKEGMNCRISDNK